MAITGTYDTQKWVKGPIKIYMNATLPADNLYPALTLGVPATGQVLGLTETGAKISGTFTESSEDADELSAPANKIISAEQMTVETTYKQIEDFTINQMMTPTGKSVVTAGVAEGIQFGGAPTIAAAAKPNVLCVGPLTSDPTKYMAFMLYSAINTSGIGFNWTKKASGGIPVKLEGQSIATRTAGNQVGAWWKTLA